ncbi:MAG: HAMP domain-containing sensor histidine kinase [Fibrobacterota bacterium]
MAQHLNKSRLNNISITTILSEVLSSWQHSVFFGKYSIKFHEPSRAKTWRVHADSGKLQQVFFNILQNACQHSPENSEVGILLKVTRDNKIIVKISDAGSGIQPQNLEHVFEPFYTTRKGGTGLGMSIVRHIVEMHSGTIALYNNTPSPGLTVEVSLPLAETVESETE